MSREIPAPAAPASSGRTLPNIQALRALAALCVVVSHAFVYVESTYGARGFSERFEILGLFGVAVFFAISGFLMSRLVRETTPWSFLTHRVIRIFPPFLAVVALFALVFRALGLPFTLQPLALTLAPAGNVTYPLNVEWTLVFETTFYVALFLVACLGLARRLPWIALGWIAILVAASFLLPEAEKGTAMPPPHRLLLSAANLPFALGLLLPELTARGWLKPWLLLLVPPAVVAGSWLDFEGARWLVGSASVLLVGCAVQTRQLSPRGPAAPLIRLGDASYLLYLAHVPVMLLTIRAFPAGWPPGLVWTAALAAPVGFAALLGRFDLRAYRWLRRRLDAATANARRTLGLAYLAMFFGVAFYTGTVAVLEQRADMRARAALSGLPAGALRSAETAAAAIAATGRALPDTVKAGADELVAPMKGQLLLGAWAIDTARPKAIFRLAAFCDGQMAGIDRARRLRPDIAAKPEFAVGKGRRIGFRLALPSAPCRSAGRVVAILVGDDGRIGLLPGASNLEPPPLP